mmetsp:Transcript_58194/g.173128  ORF Transcript_58194/g.173128 Transcript_58194/m.173128 type:complete len:470 (+) Transcript_58194:49-1458(+)
MGFSGPEMDHKVLWARIDTEHKGFLSLEELYAGLTKTPDIGISISSSSIRCLLQEADYCNSGVIEQPDFLEVFRDVKVQDLNNFKRNKVLAKVRLIQPKWCWGWHALVTLFLVCLIATFVLLFLHGSLPDDAPEVDDIFLWRNVMIVVTANLFFFTVAWSALESCLHGAKKRQAWRSQIARTEGKLRQAAADRLAERGELVSEGETATAVGRADVEQSPAAVGSDPQFRLPGESASEALPGRNSSKEHGSTSLRSSVASRNSGRGSLVRTPSRGFSRLEPDGKDPAASRPASALVVRRLSAGSRNSARATSLQVTRSASKGARSQEATMVRRAPSLPVTRTPTTESRPPDTSSPNRDSRLSSKQSISVTSRAPSSPMTRTRTKESRRSLPPPSEVDRRQTELPPHLQDVFHGRPSSSIDSGGASRSSSPRPGKNDATASTETARDSERLHSGQERRLQRTSTQERPRPR